MSLAEVQVSGEPHPLRVLILPASVAVGEDLIAQEAELTKAALSDDRIEAVVLPVRAMNLNDFTKRYADFLPDIVQFTCHGTPGGYVSFEDNGIQRRLTGHMLASAFSDIEHRIQFLFLNGCRIYGPDPIRTFVANALVSLFPSRIAMDISPLGVRAFYSALSALGVESENLSRLDTQILQRMGSNIEITTQILSRESKPRVQPRLESDIESNAQQRYDIPRYVEEQRYDLSLDLANAHSSGRARQPEVIGGRGDRPRIYRVWFGTNRRPEVATRLGPHYGSDRDKATHYGYCDVIIPKYHIIGSLGQSWWERFPHFLKRNSLSLAGITELPTHVYWERLQTFFAALSSLDRSLLIFIHGYNVPFVDAALRAAQIGFDLQIPGTTAMFSWPSQGNVHAYLADEATIEASENALRDFIVGMASSAGAERIHLIAHSMGNRALLRVFSTLTETLCNNLRPIIQQIFLAAPDVDVDVFERLAVVYQRVSERTTMYSSARDRALLSSGLVHDYPRAGYTPPITALHGLDTIEVTNIDLTFLGHGYIAQAREVLNDMHQLVQHNSHPDSRFGLKKISHGATVPYWQMLA